MTFDRIGFTGLSCLVVSACAPRDATPDGAPDPAALAEEPIAEKPVADPGPLLPLRTGIGEPQKRPPIEVEATATFTKSGHRYLAFRLDGSTDSVETLRVEGDRHAVAAHGAEPSRWTSDWNWNATPPDPGSAEVVVRLAGEALPLWLPTVAISPLRGGSPTDGLRIRRIGLPRPGWSDRWQPAWTEEVTVRVPRRLREDRELETRFFEKLALDLEAAGRGEDGRATPFHAFAAGRARLLAGGAATRPGGAEVPARRSEIDEMMRLYTGMTSVAEALQTDRGLLLREDAGRGTIPLAEVEPLALPVHPWEEMIRERSLDPRTEPLAGAVPADLLYVHFGDLREAVRVMKDLEAWVRPIADALERTPGRLDLAARYETRLAVERTGLAEKLGHVAADGVALVFDDPFVREGTDLALVFRVKNRPLLAGALAAFEARARERHAGTEVRSTKVRGHEVRSLTSPDGRVDQHRIEVGDVLVLATSAALAARFAAVADRLEPPLSDSGDFRYLRGLYPYDPGAETGFVFVGDAFVTRAVSPKTKILEARRMAGLADLSAAGFAGALHGLLEGAPAADTKALLASGVLREADLRHAGGEPIALDPATGASSALWGRLDAATPLGRLPLERVTEAERDAYDRFRQTYQAYWRGYVDPIGARIVRSPDGRTLSVDARMLPLLEGTDYDELERMAGRALVEPPDLRSGVQWTFAVGEDAELRRELDGLGRFLDLDTPLSGWLGGFVAAGVSSRSGLRDLALLDPTLPERREPGEPSRSRDQPTLLRVLGRAPVWAAAEVRNPLALAATLTALRAMVDSAAAGLVTWGDAGAYRGVRLVAIRPGAEAVRDLGTADLALYYAVPGRVLVASPDLGTLEEVVDLVLEGRFARSAGRSETAAGSSAAQTSLDLALDPGAPWLGRVLAGLLEADARLSLRRAFLDVETLALALGGLPPDPESFERAALGTLGYVPASPQGGTFRVLDGGEIEHSLYGTRLRPRYDDVPLPGAPLATLVEGLRGLSASLSFEGEGRSRGLHATVSLRRR